MVMNKKCSLIKSLLKGDIISVSNSIRLTGLSNPAREITRQIEKPFGVIISRNKVETKDQFGNYCTYHEYRLNPRITGNSEGIKKMSEYLLKEGAVEKAGKKVDKGKFETSQLY
jgi:hypothetical protein